MSDFAIYRKRNTSFIVKNTDPFQRTVKIFTVKLLYLNQIDLLEIPGIGIDDIKTSLLRGELSEKLRANILEVVFSDLETNQEQISFLEAEGVTEPINAGWDMPLVVGAGTKHFIYDGPQVDLLPIPIAPTGHIDGGIAAIVIPADSVTSSLGLIIPSNLNVEGDAFDPNLDYIIYTKFIDNIFISSAHSIPNRDLIKPTIVAGFIDSGNKDVLTLQFSEAVYISNLAGLSLSFSVGTPRTISSISDGNGSYLVEFSLSGSASDTDVITLSIASNSIQDLNGNLLDPTSINIEVLSVVGTFIFDGDSNATGQGIPERFSTLITTPYNVTEVNAAASSHTLVDVLSGISSIAIPANRVLYVLVAGTNDIALGGITDPAIMLSREIAVVNAVRARFLGSIVAVTTILPATAITGSAETCRLAVNASRLLLESGADLCIDFANIPELTNPADTKYYGDGVHINILGHEYALYELYETLRGFPGIPTPVTELAHITDLSGCITELQADSGITDSGGVTVWADESSNAHNFVVSTLGKATYNLNDGDGHPSVQFDGVNDGLLHEYSANPSVTHLNTGNPYTIISYWRAPITGDGVLFKFAGAVFEGASAIRLNSSLITHTVQDDSNHASEHGLQTFLANTWHMNHITHNGSGTFSVGHNTVTPTGATVASFGASTSKRVTLGLWLADAGVINPRASRIRTFALFQRVLTTTEIWQIRYFLRRTQWLV